MDERLREQAYWLLLAFESKLPKRIINDIVEVWCHKHGRTLEEFFGASSQEWNDTCQLDQKTVGKLEQAKGKFAEQASLVEKLSQEQVRLLTVQDNDYPKLLRSALPSNQKPPVLFYAGDLHILDLITIAIIGSRNAEEASLAFTRCVAQYLAEQGANVISGNARGVDRAAFEGATSSYGCTTVVLPEGILKLSGAQMRELRPRIEAGNVLLLSQFHPCASWTVSRAMERNTVVTGLAQVVIVAESNLKGGTWNAANGALKQQRPVYVRQKEVSQSSGNQALIELGGRPLVWSANGHTGKEAVLEDVMSPVLEESEMLYHRENYDLTLLSQLSHLLKEHRVSL